MYVGLSTVDIEQMAKDKGVEDAAVIDWIKSVIIANNKILAEEIPRIVEDKFTRAMSRRY